MTRKIYKYPIRVSDEVQSVQMPKSGTIIHLDNSSGLVYEKPEVPTIFVDLWVMFDDNDEEVVTRHFVTVPTGKPFEDDLNYLQTVLIRHEDLFAPKVLHVFEKQV